MDRQTLSMAAPLVQRELSLDNTHMGMLFSAFFYTYGLMMAVTGWILDRVSVRFGYAASVLLWSLAGAATGVTRTFKELFAVRLLLGAAEAANWPAALRTIAKLMPPRNRSLANGLFNAGASAGAIVTPPLMVYLSMRWSWRFAFVAIGILGFLWVFIWLALTRRITELSSFPARDTMKIDEFTPTDSLSSWRSILVAPRFWGLMLAAVCGNPCYYFYSTWLPTYFVQQRAMHFGPELGRLMLLPYIGLGLGSALGGLPVFWLTRRGWTIYKSRKVTFALISIFVLPVIIVTYVGGFVAAVAIIVIAAIGMGAWIANYISGLQDLSPRHVAAVSGTIGCFGAFAGAISMWAVGVITSRPHGFNTVFYALAVIPGIGSLGIIIPRSPKLETQMT